MAPSEWSTVVPYASRVKVLTYQRGSYSYAATDVWRSLTISRPDSTPFLFPNLRDLSWSEDVSFIRMVLPPTLIRLELWASSDATESILRSLYHLCPSLQEVILFGEPDILSQSSIMHPISQWVNLRRLTLGWAPSPAAFAHMKRLEYLCITFDFYEDPQDISTPVVFPALREFKFKGTALYWVTSLLSFIHSPHLETVHLTISAYKQASSWTKLLIALGRSNTLISVTIRDINHVYRGYLNQEAIIPLFSLSNLIHLELQPNQGFDIGDEILCHLSLTFPHLRSLVLGSLTSTWTRPSRITLVGLIPLIANCPQLHHLSIVINATIIPDACISTPTPNTNLKTLQVGHSRISDPTYVAAFLVDLLPNVTGIVHKWGCSVKEAEAWNNVGVFMKKFKGSGRR